MTRRERLIRQLSRQYGLDPEASDAIAHVEGPSALRDDGVAIGDHGTSYGPFQLHEGGALPRGKGSDWAHSPAGIKYAIRQMAGVARGLHGQAAVAAIVRRFERPLDPASEIAKAMGYYGHLGGGDVPAGVGTPPPRPGQAPAPGLNPDFKQLAAGLLLNNATQTVEGQRPDFGSLIQLAMARKQMQQAAQNFGPLTPNAKAPLKPPRVGGKVSWIGDLTGVHPRLINSIAAAARAAGATKVKVTSGYRSPAHNAAVGGVPHSNHMTGDAVDGYAFVPGRGWIPLGALLRGTAGRYGLRSGDVPGFYNGNPDPVHVDDGANQR